MKKKSNINSFENNLTRLEEISDLLENETIGLDEALVLYEEGIKLSMICMDSLKNAELKITELKKMAGDLSPDVNDNFEE
jgi:exodeoxyribonuclease VII small subunit